MIGRNVYQHVPTYLGAHAELLQLGMGSVLRAGKGCLGLPSADASLEGASSPTKYFMVKIIFGGVFSPARSSSYYKLELRARVSSVSSKSAGV